MGKKVLYYSDARKAIQQGMDILSKAVSITLGPKGKNVVLEHRLGAPQIVNDGATIAKEIELENPFQNAGAALMKQVALKTNDIAGDGTTTATILAHAIAKEGIKNMAMGSNPILIKKGIEKAVKFAVTKIAQYSRSIEDTDDVAHIASISAGNDREAGFIIAEAIHKAGKEGTISLEEGQSTVTSLEIVEGIRFDKGPMSPSFISDTTGIELVQDNPYLLLTDRKITLVRQELVPILEQVSKAGRPLLIIAEDIDREALATIVLNKLKGVVNVVAVRAPGFGDRRKAFLQDLSVLTGAKVITDDAGFSLETISLDVMGSARRVTVSKKHTTIISQGNDKLIKLRCDYIKKQIERNDDHYEKEKLQERLSKLSARIVVIKLGAATNAEMNDKKLRFEDAINATKSAIAEGVVPGGGSTLIHLSQELNSWAHQYLLNEELIGALIIKKALSVPLSRIVSNAGSDGLLVKNKVQRMNFPMGYDAYKDTIVDMYRAGIIDPVKVTRSALQNAASIATMILTTECVVI